MSLVDIFNSPRRIDDLEEEIDDVTDRIDSLESDDSEIQAQIDDLWERMDNIEGTESFPSEDIESLASRIEALERSDRPSFEEEFNDLWSAIESGEATRRSLGDSVSELDQRVSELEESPQIDPDELQEIRDDLDAIEPTGDLRTIVESLEAKVSSMEAYDDTELREEIGVIREELSSGKSGDIEDLTDRVQSLEEKVSDDEGTLRVDSVSTTLSESVYKSGSFDIRGYLVKGDEDGPTAVVIGGMHGDEDSGYLYASDLIRTNPLKGDLYVIPRMSGPSTLTSSRRLDGHDLNREFPRGSRPSTPLVRAVWSKIQDLDPDVVIDLHSSSGLRGRDSGGKGQCIWATSNASTEATNATKWTNARSVSTKLWGSDYKWMVEANQSSGSGIDSLIRKIGSDTNIDGHLVEVVRDPPIETQIQWFDMLIRALLEEYDIYV